MAETHRDPQELHLGRTARMLGRALRLRCPNCGVGRMFRRWVHMLPHCSNCAFRFDRGESDYFIGAYTINLIVAELMIVIAFVIAMVVTWPDVPWNLIKWGLIGFMIPFPLFTYPFSKALWVAVDLIFRPADPSDFVS